ncbi:Hypothetical protein R9X50_00350900 [Acrodontium crateriforme]|uniref:Uncharacterized protein n=1 Tax=Acrodontium crateriforme TaxID=150365 RepID=A0AAQ3M321_9PEZI|nr:Hypothetical protein R9X50_00350900 [Acrodontium crateriforme]
MSVLRTRDANLPFNTSQAAMNEKSNEVSKPKSGAALRRHMFEQKSVDKTGQTSDGSSKAYVSPSDAIMSPASQKLAGFKQRQINKTTTKNPTARSLFARTPSNSSSGFDDVDVPTTEQK